MDFVGEATFTKDVATVGMKMNSSILKGGTPDFGVRVLRGPFFGSLVTKDKFTAFTTHFFYKASDDFKCAATYTAGGSDNGKWTAGVNYKGIGKAKIDQDQTFSFSMKHVVSKGFTLLGGASYSLKNSSTTCGLQLSIA